MMAPTLKEPKVFGVGFHKTGTTSLAEALRMLGYTVTGPDGVNRPDIARRALPMALRLAARFDGFQDNPWPILFREMDRHFPGSRFVLTLRPTHEWIASLVRHFAGRSTPMREWIYGAGDPVGHEETYVRRYEAHNQAVLSYFRDRPDHLLVLRITEGEGWDRLCPFLGTPVPGEAFPHRNAKAVRDEAGSGEGTPWPR